MSKADDKNGVPSTLTTIPLTDPHAKPAEPSIGDLIKDATAQVSTLVRAEVELARAEITRDVKKGLTGSVFFIAALVVSASCSAAESRPRLASVVCRSSSTLDVVVARPAPSPASSQLG